MPETSVLNEIAYSLKGRHILDTVSHKTPDGSILYWGLTGGHTIKIRVVNRVKVAWEEIPEPLGVVARHTIVS